MHHGPRTGARKSATPAINAGRYSRVTRGRARARSMRAAGAGGEDSGSSALLLCAAGDGVGSAALLSLPRRAQLLVNAPEGVSRLALEHRVRPTGRLAALLLTSLSPDAAVRCSIHITFAHVEPAYGCVAAPRAACRGCCFAWLRTATARWKWWGRPAPWRSCKPPLRSSSGCTRRRVGARTATPPRGPCRADAAAGVCARRAERGAVLRRRCGGRRCHVAARPVRAVCAARRCAGVRPEACRRRRCAAAAEQARRGRRR